MIYNGSFSSYLEKLAEGDKLESATSKPLPIVSHNSLDTHTDGAEILPGTFKNKKQCYAK